MEKETKTKKSTRYWVILRGLQGKELKLFFKHIVKYNLFMKGFNLMDNDFPVDIKLRDLAEVDCFIHGVCMAERGYRIEKVIDDDNL